MILAKTEYFKDKDERRSEYFKGIVYEYQNNL